LFKRGIDRRRSSDVCFSFTFFSSRVSKLTLFVGAIALIVIAPAQLRAQRSEPEPHSATSKACALAERRRARKKLGNPRDKVTIRILCLQRHSGGADLYDKTAKVSRFQSIT